MLTDPDQINYLARMQGYRDMLQAIEHTPAICDVIARVIVHIEVFEDNFEQTLQGKGAQVPSDLFRITHWFESVMKGMMQKDTPDD